MTSAAWPGVDRPGLPQRPGDVVAVHQQLARQQPEGDVGAHRLAAVKAEGRQLAAIPPDLCLQGGQLPGEAGGEVACGHGAECPYLSVVERGQLERGAGPGAAPLGAIGVADHDGGKVGGDVAHRPAGGVRHLHGRVGRRGH